MTITTKELKKLAFHQDPDDVIHQEKHGHTLCDTSSRCKDVEDLEGLKVALKFKCHDCLWVIAKQEERKAKVAAVVPEKVIEYKTSLTECNCPAKRFQPQVCKHIEALRQAEALRSAAEKVADAALMAGLFPPRVEPARRMRG